MPAAPAKATNSPSGVLSPVWGRLATGLGVGTGVLTGCSGVGVGVEDGFSITNKKYTSPQITSPLWTDIFYITSLLFFKYHFI